MATQTSDNQLLSSIKVTNHIGNYAITDQNVTSRGAGGKEGKGDLYHT